MAANEGIFDHILNCQIFHLGVLMDLGEKKAVVTASIFDSRLFSQTLNSF